MYSFSVLDGFASGLRRLSADLTVRYRVQTILGRPVSGLAKKKAQVPRGACSCLRDVPEICG
jgi:hypothetical protein